MAGPIEDNSWPATIEGFVGDPRDPTRLHGYDTWGDLARHYSFAEVLLTALRGTAPDASVGRAFELALTLLVPLSIADGAVHGASLAHMLSAPATSVVASAALGLVEQADALVASHGAWLDWLENPVGEPPADFLARSERERECVAMVRAAIDLAICPVLARVEPTVEATVLALMYACGLRSVHELTAAIVTARVSTVVAEATRHRPGEQRTYPMQLPPFDYVEGDDG